MLALGSEEQKLVFVLLSLYVANKVNFTIAKKVLAVEVPQGRDFGRPPEHACLS